MRRYGFSSWEISQEAYDVYINSDFTFYRVFHNRKYEYYVSYNQNGEIRYIGSLEDVEEFLLQFVEKKERL